MCKVKLLKDINRYNVSGFDKHTLTGKEEEVVEVSHFNMKILVKDGLAEEYVEEPENDSEDDPDNADATTETGAKGSETGAEGSGDGKTGNPPPADANTTASDDDADTFTLTPEAILHIQKLTKDKIELILRGYSVEADKRKKLADLQEELILTVGTSLPDDAAKSANVIEHLLAYYKETFAVELSAKFYNEKNLSQLTEDMSKIITEALSNEDS